MEGKRYNTNTRWVLEAPYRTTTVRDTLSDLPRIENGASKLEMSYKGDGISHFQKKIRRDSDVLRDHITKPMSALVEARFRLIPTAPGSDWRDLPNKVGLALMLSCSHALLLLASKGSWKLYLRCPCPNLDETLLALPPGDGPEERREHSEAGVLLQRPEAGQVQRGRPQGGLHLHGE